MLCRQCLHGHLAPTLLMQERFGLNLYSFYEFEEIKRLLHYKYKPSGYFLFRALAKETFRLFKNSNILPIESYCVVAIDDDPKENFSHTALFARALGAKQFSILRDYSGYSYAGKSLQWRIDHPRDFRLHKLPAKQVILVDDVVTTGLTLQQAKRAIEQNGGKVAAAVVLSAFR